MSWLYRLICFRTPRGLRDARLDEELQGHLDLEAEERRGSGVTDSEARYAARRAFGNVALVREDVRAVWPGASMKRLFRGASVRNAFRALKATPIVSAVAILSLALGVGANAAIFSILNSLLLRSLPVRAPDELVQLFTGPERPVWTNPLWEDLRHRQDLFEGAFAYFPTQINLAKSGETDLIEGLWVSGGFFDVLGVPAVLGRTLMVADDVRGGGLDGPVATISYGFWQRRFGGRSDIVGQTLPFGQTTFTIVGVTPPAFFGVEVGRRFDVALPIGTRSLLADRSLLDGRKAWWLRVMARLKAGDDLGRATTRLNAVQPEMRIATLPDRDALQSYLKEPFVLQPAASGSSALRRQYSQPLAVLMAVVGLVLLIACANIANLLSARSITRRHELSVRLALGASRGSLACQLLVESALLSGSGAALGLVFADWSSRLLVRQLSAATNTVSLGLTMDWRVLSFTAAVAITTTLLFGSVPAVRATRVQPNEVLKEHGRSVSGDGQFRLGHALVVGQVALSLVLVVGAGLLMQTFASLATLNLGFDRDPVLVVSTNAKNSGASAAQRNDLIERIREAVSALPGVDKVGLSTLTPLISSGAVTVEIDDVASRPIQSEEDRQVSANRVSPGWFGTLGTPILAGRDFDGRDVAGSPRVVIVNETLVRRLFNGRNPLGQILHGTAFPGDSANSLEVVGVVRDVVSQSLRETPPPTLYSPLAQATQPPTAFDLSVRSSAGQPTDLIRSVTAAIGQVDKNVSLTFRPLREQIDASLVRERMLAILSGFFGVLAILLAGLGLYGVLSYAVARRRTEFGIRLAVGASPAEIVRLMFQQVALLLTIGIIIGGVVAMWAARFLTALLYGLQPRDPATLLIAAGVLAVIGATAGLLPALRASRLDPVKVLRAD